MSAFGPCPTCARGQTESVYSLMRTRFARLIEISGSRLHRRVDGICKTDHPITRIRGSLPARSVRRPLIDDHHRRALIAGGDAGGQAGGAGADDDNIDFAIPSDLLPAGGCRGTARNGDRGDTDAGGGAPARKAASVEVRF